MWVDILCLFLFFFQAEDGIRDLVRSRGLGDVYKRQVGYFLANLGYLLVGAGMIKGTFKIFALKKRWHVLGAGALAFLVGTFLSNIGP